MNAACWQRSMVVLIIFSFSLTDLLCTHLAVFLVLAPHLFAEAPRCFARSVWRDNVVVDQSWQVSPYSGQVSTVGQPWWTGETQTDTHSWDQVKSNIFLDFVSGGFTQSVQHPSPSILRHSTWYDKTITINNHLRSEGCEKPQQQCYYCLLQAADGTLR